MTKIEVYDTDSEMLSDLADEFDTTIAEVLDAIVAYLFEQCECEDMTVAELIGLR